MQLRDLLSRMAEPNPRRRITAAEVLEHPCTTGTVAKLAQYGHGGGQVGG